MSSNDTVQVEASGATGACSEVLKEDHLIETMPELPAEVCGIIAEYLAGDLAFGTLANLNRTSRLVHLETSPVLFETVLFTDTYYDYCKETPPRSLKYTKTRQSPKWHAKACDDRHFQLSWMQSLCSQTVDTRYRPCRLRTPVCHPTPNHSACLNAIPPEFHQRINAECDKHLAKGIAPVEMILSVDLAASACIRNDLNPSYTEASSGVIPYGAHLTISADIGDRSGIQETALSLLRMATLQSADQQARSAVQDYELYLLKRKQGNFGIRCRLQPRYTGYHLALELSEQESDRFIERLAEDVERTPEILRNRISISIIGGEPAAGVTYLESVISRMRNLFEEHVDELARYLNQCRRRIFKCSFTKVSRNFGEAIFQSMRLLVSTEDSALSFEDERDLSNTTEDWVSLDDVNWRVIAAGSLTPLGPTED